MKKKRKTDLFTSVCLLAAFAAFTVAVVSVDVSAIGPCGSKIGFSHINAAFHAVTGVNMALYTLTDWLGLIPIFVCLCYAAVGLIQLIKRRSIFKVDKSITALGIFYIAVIAAYVLFEKMPINYRPVLINGSLEVSYPSSTTLLVLTVMPSAAVDLKDRIKQVYARRLTVTLIWTFTAFTVFARLISGVHWLTDIVGGVLLSGALVCGYRAIA